MKKSRIKLMTSILTTTLIASLAVGCGSKKEEASSTSENKNMATGEVKYPIKSDATLKYWSAINGNVSPNFKSLGETELSKELEKKTGIKVEYIHPAQGQEKEQFNLMIASGDLPDIIEYNWSAFPGGPEKAIEDKVITKLNDLVDKYAPNFKKVMAEDKTREKFVKTDQGNIYDMSFVRGDDILTVFYGPMLRADWLKELGLQPPTTIDEWENVLKTFKEKKGVPAPFTANITQLYGAFVGAYGVDYNYYLDNGKVKYGPIEPQFKEFLTLFNKWYKDGLIDKNFASLDLKAKDSSMLSDKSGATLGYTGSTMGSYLKAKKDKDPKFDLVGVPNPTLKKGETPIFAQKDFKMVFTTGYAVSENSKNKELATRWLDYGYSKEGNMLYNFGIEGVSYKLDNNYPKYTDEVLNNPNKLPMSQALAKYTRASYNGPFVQRKEYVEQFYSYDQQKSALATWSKNQADKTNLPPITPLPEETAEVAKIDNDVKTFVDETVIKFIMGTEPLSNYDKFVEKVKKLNIQKSIDIKQKAFERFNKR